MDLKTYESLTRSEAASRRYLAGFCWPGGHRFCPRCRCRKLYRLADGRRRCSGCAYTFHDFSRRWLSECGLTPGQWLRLLKLFELEVGATQCAEQLGISYNTAYKATCVIRRAIMAHADDSSLYFGPGAVLPEVFCGRRPSCTHEAASAIPVFGITGNNEGRAQASPVPDLWPETVYYLNVRSAKLGNILYTDRYRHYDTLVFCGRRYVRAGRAPRNGGSVYVDGVKGFWSTALDRLRRCSGVSPARFPLYLKEQEFRYNHRGRDVFEVLASYLSGLVPGRA